METDWQTQGKSLLLTGRALPFRAMPGRRMAVLVVLLFVLSGAQADQPVDRYAGKVVYTAHSPPVVIPTSFMNKGIVGGVVLLVVVALAFPIGATFLGRHPDSSMRRPAKTRHPFETLFEDEPTLRAFFEALRAGPEALDNTRAGSVGVFRNSIQAGASGSRAEPPPVPKLFESASGQIELLRKLFAEASRTNDGAVRQKILLDVAETLRPFKELCSAPGLLPIWQLACALEALLRQLARKDSDVTPSALKTAAGALDLFQTLSALQSVPDAVADSPARLLAVDDDAVSLRALSLALQKAF